MNRIWFRKRGKAKVESANESERDTKGDEREEASSSRSSKRVSFAHQLYEVLPEDVGTERSEETKSQEEGQHGSFCGSIFFLSF